MIAIICHAIFWGIVWGLFWSWVIGMTWNGMTLAIMEAFMR
jgi:hypothetical protein